MIIQTEQKAEDFLRKSGFKVIESFYVTSEKKLDELLKKISFPIVMKVAGNKIIHKKKINGVKLNIQNHNSAMKVFNELMKIENAEGVIIQKQVSGKEFLLGIKKTPEFGHVIGFGTGGSDVEKIKDVIFRVCPIDIKNAINMIKESNKGRELNEREIAFFTDYLLKLCSLIQKNPKIKELDINPLILENNGEGFIVDARILWEE